MTDRRTNSQESPQVGTHGSAPDHDVTKDMTGETTNADTGAGGWDERSQQDPLRPSDALEREMQRGRMTKEAQPSGTMPLERDQRPINQSR
jgi:hypothetical protein